MPKLTQSYNTAPSLVGYTRMSMNDGKEPAKDPLSGGKFYVDLGALRTAEQTCLDASNTSVNAYESLRKIVQAAVASDRIFGQIVGKDYPNKQVRDPTLPRYRR
ncbi:hypothetical protein NKH18_15040 [Streptomyces sp. M10(2022)]